MTSRLANKTTSAQSAIKELKKSVQSIKPISGEVEPPEDNVENSQKNMELRQNFGKLLSKLSSTETRDLVSLYKSL